MQKLRPYIPIVTKLIIDLLVMGYVIGRKVVLPNRRRKGNLLYSIFLLFTTLTERSIAFKQALTKTPLRFGKKYIRLAVLFVTWGLCVLASLEWSGTPATTSDHAPMVATSVASTQMAAVQAPVIQADTVVLFGRDESAFGCKTDRRIAFLHWLRFCALRI